MGQFITIKNEEGKICPSIGIWEDNDLLKYSKPEIAKYMKKAEKQGEKLVRVEIKEIKEISINDIKDYS